MKVNIILLVYEIKYAYPLCLFFFSLFFFLSHLVAVSWSKFWKFPNKFKDIQFICNY